MFNFDELRSAFRFHMAAQRMNAPRVPMTARTHEPAEFVDREPQRFFQRNASIALRNAREDVAAGTKRYVSAPGRKPLPGTKEASDRAERIQAAEERGYRGVYIESEKAGGFRFVGYADVISSRHASRAIDHTGWFTSDDQGETFRGAVLQLPARKGRIRLVAAYLESTNGGYVLDLSLGAVFEEEIGSDSSDPCEHDSAMEAARTADSFAEREAERERDYQEAWRAGQDWSDLGDGIATARKAALQILRERRSLPAGLDKPALCAAIREKVESLVDEIRKARAKREELVSLPLSRTLAEAFNEGAGSSVFTA